MSSPEESLLKVRRSILIKAAPARVWEAFASLDTMRRWWGYVEGTPEAGSSKGQWLDVYEPRVGGRIEMAVMWDGVRVSYGGAIVVFDGRELTFESDWMPNRGWEAPTFITVRLAPAPQGTLVELLHHGFERTGADADTEHEGYETGWGMTQLSALKRFIEGA